jgi:hypothetical protein
MGQQKMILRLKYPKGNKLHALIETARPFFRGVFGELMNGVSALPQIESTFRRRL